MYFFTSEIFVVRNNRRVNAKRMLGLISLGIKEGYTINLIAGGSDEDKALETLIDFLEKLLND
ncbi:HPr family phosphocarrier protein [Paraliobacillus ryukyuensis]|uniref:HPr family phosphocarrier protein n=1 Tax=Paraliobacillus ryukyuensis TaxID=200904 RepID=UPI0009A81DC9|nr:HPr family phosphocarrier protein [Paraliobacillus ryukyuensis]